MHSDAQQYAETAWRIAWERLYHPRTSLFYDFVSSYDAARRFDHLPNPEEIARQFPNTNGWATGMEDSVINGGVMLAAVCDRYKATGDSALRDDASRIFRGLELCGTLSRRKGYVLRSVSPFDGRSHYIETSRDQVTHFVHGLWRYFHSKLSDDAVRQRIAGMITNLCVLMEQSITEENGHHICKENGDRGIVDMMWNVQPHEICRLPMVYAVGWDMTGDRHWWKLYRKLADEASQQAAQLEPERYTNAYALFQHQVSLEVLTAVESEDANPWTQWETLMAPVAEGSERFLTGIENYVPCDVRELDMNWRHWPTRQDYIESGYGHVPEWPDDFMQKEFAPLRETGEALLMQLMVPGRTLRGEQFDVLERALAGVCYDLVFTYAMLYPQAAYWRHLRNEMRT